MRKKALFLLFLLLYALRLDAQQAQCPTCPIFATNAKYVNGTAPGYAPTAGSGLTLNLSSGTVNCANTIRTYAAGTLTMTNSTTNYVYLDATSNCVPASNTSGFTSTTIPIATVVAAGGVITTITDNRTFGLASASAGGSLGATLTNTHLFVGNASNVATDVAASGDVSLANTGAVTISNNAVTAAKSAVVLTRRTCGIVVGADNGSALANADLGPQGRQCFVPFAATVVEVEVAADAGTPNVIMAKNHAGTISNLVSSALATASSGGIACSNTGGTTGLDGTTTCSGTLQNTSLAAGDYIELVSGTAGGTAKRMSIFITYTVS